MAARPRPRVAGPGQRTRTRVRPAGHADRPSPRAGSCLRGRTGARLSWCHRERLGVRPGIGRPPAPSSPPRASTVPPKPVSKPAAPRTQPRRKKKRRRYDALSAFAVAHEPADALTPRRAITEDRPMRVASILAFGLVLVSASGCASTSGAVRDRFAAEFECHRDEVRVTDLGSGGYRARGCGQEARYAASCALYCRVVREDH